jgi:hypothetical protein
MKLKIQPIEFKVLFKIKKEKYLQLTDLQFFIPNTLWI